MRTGSITSVMRRGSLDGDLVLGELQAMRGLVELMERVLEKV